MLESILKSTEELKKEIYNRISSNECFIEKDLLMSTYCQLEDIQKKITHITKYYETYNNVLNLT